MTTQQRPQTWGPKEIPNGGVITGRQMAKFEADGANYVSGIYNDSGSAKTHHMGIWCLAPGQENSMQWHETISHIFVIQEGEGIYMKGDPYKAPEDCPKATSPTPAPGFKPKFVPIKAGDVIFIPERTVHGIRNTGKTNLSYMAIQLGDVYSRIDVGPQVSPHRNANAPGGH